MNNRIIIVITNRKDAVLGSMERVLGSKFIVKTVFNGMPAGEDLLADNVLLVGFDSLDVSRAGEMIDIVKSSSAPILVLDGFVENEGIKEGIQELVKALPKDSNLIFNIDDKLIKEISSNAKESSFTFGFDDKADFKASDVNINGGLNFKLNYNGKIMPMWQNNPDNDYAYGALVASCVGMILGFNLVEISELLKSN